MVLVDNDTVELFFNYKVDNKFHKWINKIIQQIGYFQ